MREVVEQIGDTLDAQSIQYCCISAYSAVEGREYDYVGQSLDEALCSWNKPTRRDKRLCHEVTGVLDAYIEAFKDEIKARSTHKNELHSLKLDLDELGLFDDADMPAKNSFAYTFANTTIKNARQDKIKEKALERLERFSELFTIKKIEAHMNEAGRLREHMIRLFAEDW